MLAPVLRPHLRATAAAIVSCLHKPMLVHNQGLRITLDGALARQAEGSWLLCKRAQSPTSDCAAGDGAASAGFKPGVAVLCNTSRLGSGMAAAILGLVCMGRGCGKIGKCYAALG